LNLKDVELPRADDRRREGDRLHAVLEAFFKGIGAPADWADFERYCTNRLWELSERLLPRSYLESAEGLQLRFTAWPAFARHLARLYDEASWHRARHGLREHGFRSPGFRGKVDSVDTLPEMHVITDYKRSGAPQTADVRSGIAPQLPVYAAAMADDGLALDRAVVGYWRILDGSWVGIGAGAEAMVAAKGRGLLPPKHQLSTEALVQTVEELVAWRRSETAKAGAYLPDPSQCGFCKWAGICRKDDPQARPLFAERDLLARKLGKPEEADDA
jgi:hypothetical protein